MWTIVTNKFLKRSFTLIEVLVVTGIILIFTGMVMGSYNNFNQQKDLDKEVSRVIDILNLARSKAQNSDLLPKTGVTPVISLDCFGTNEFGGYRVELTETDYKFKQCCRDTSSRLTTICSSAIHSYTLPQEIENISGNVTVEFYPLAEGATETSFTFKNNSVNKCSDIVISATGVINTTDPQPC